MSWRHHLTREEESRLKRLELIRDQAADATREERRILKSRAENRARKRRVSGGNDIGADS